LSEIRRPDPGGCASALGSGLRWLLLDSEDLTPAGAGVRSSDLLLPDSEDLAPPR